MRYIKKSKRPNDKLQEWNNLMYDKMCPIRFNYGFNTWKEDDDCLYPTSAERQNEGLPIDHPFFGPLFLLFAHPHAEVVLAAGVVERLLLGPVLALEHDEGAGRAQLRHPPGHAHLAQVLVQLGEVWESSDTRIEERATKLDSHGTEHWDDKYKVVK